MRQPDDKRRKSPVERFRKILSAEEEHEAAREVRKPAVVKLPPVRIREESLPAQPIVSPETSSSESPVRRGLLPVFWTVASIASLIVNIILLALVIGLWRGLGGPGTAGPGGGLLAGLYGSFEQMDLAHIKATIPVQTNIPFNASVPVKATTTITLSHDVAVQGAHVRISTGPFNIDAPASVTLPAGTALDVDLDLTLPVQTNVPIALDVPVDIAVRDTDLHPAILGLEESIKPLLCASSPETLSVEGEPVCK
jgi:hypothetical protein